jgi:Zn-dependent M28 family amino/carboxypeptidase
MKQITRNTIPAILLLSLLVSCSPTTPIIQSPTEWAIAEINTPTDIVTIPPLEPTKPAQIAFDGERALKDVEYQVSLGPRTVGSPAHQQTGDWIIFTLQDAGWETETQETELAGQPIRNVIGKWGGGEPWLILGAHYDSRIVADRDPDPNNWSAAVPGANDGASGAAVLLELARVLPTHADQLRFGQIWLVFFDAEDNGSLPGVNSESLPSNGWILGSTTFVQSLTQYPQAAVIVDMIGDADQNIYQEKNSHPGLTAEIWQAAGRLGYQDRFIAAPKWAILDDHTPFLQVGIPAVDIIDFDYPYYHTIEDTPDKVSVQSLKTVGDTLIEWMTTRTGP